MADSSKKYILVAEDDAAYASVYQHKLTKEGYEVNVALNGNEVMKMVRERKPDLILLDLIMPEMDGFETLVALSKDEALKDIIVVVTSNLGQDEDILKAKNLGANDYLVKANTSIMQLMAKVKEYVG